MAEFERENDCSFLPVTRPPRSPSQSPPMCQEDLGDVPMYGYVDMSERMRWLRNKCWCGELRLIDRAYLMLQPLGSRGPPCLAASAASQKCTSHAV